MTQFLDSAKLERAKVADSRTKDSPILTWKKLAVDAGNRSIKYFDEAGRYACIPSVVKLLDEWDSPMIDAQSVVCQYRSGNSELIGKRWTVGQVAVDLAGSPTFEAEKAELAPYLVLPMIAPLDGKRQFVIEKLICCLPNHLQRDKVETIQKALTGIHQYDRNDEVLTVHIRAVLVEPETLGAYRFARSQGLFRYSRPNAILDLGGKTGIGQIFTANGSMPSEGRVIVPGSYDLALRVAKHPMLMQLDYTPDLTLILNAIAEGSLSYGTTGISFAELFPQYLNSWMTDIRNKLRIGWAKWVSDLGEVVIVGGSAPLAQSLVDATAGRFKIADDAQFANVCGMRMN